jgi:hypothetical protein
MMTIFIADELAKKKFVDSDFRYATLKMRAGFGWPFSATGPKASTPDIAASRLRRTALEIKSCA